MYSFLIKLVTKKIFNENMLNKFGSEDPYYEEIDISSGETIKHKKIAKKEPLGITEHDARIYRKVKRRAYRLDLLFNFCGLRFGISQVIGAVPVIGTIFTMFLSLMIFKLSLQVEKGLPFDIQCKMVLNIIIDFVLGLVPIIGDFIDIIYKANSRNLLLLEKHLIQVGQVNMGTRDHVDGISTEQVKEYLDKVQIPERVSSLVRRKNN